MFTFFSFALLKKNPNKTCQVRKIQNQKNMLFGGGHGGNLII